MYLQLFIKKKTRLNQLHSFVRENYSSPRPALELADHFYVVSEEPAKFDQAEKTFKLKTEFLIGEEVSVFCRVSFSSRGKNNYVKPLDSKEALLKFLTSTGLSLAEEVGGSLRGSARFMGRVAERKFDVMNAFEVTGVFEVKDPSKLSTAILNGIGARKSYGFGLLLIKDAC